MSKHVTGHIKMLCLLGSPVEHSISHEMHNEAADLLLNTTPVGMTRIPGCLIPDTSYFHEDSSFRTSSTSRRRPSC